MDRKLYRSVSDRKIAGICGGLGEFFGIDSTIIRIIWVLISLAWGSGIVLYIAMWFIVPENPYDDYV